MNDEMANKQIQRMVTFIETEGDKRVIEVQQQIEEEYEMLKKKLVEDERKKVDEEYSKKYEQLEKRMKIDISSIKTQGRMGVMEAKKDRVQNLLEEAKHRLPKMTDDQKRYCLVLEKLLLQGLLILLEPHVKIRCRETDTERVQAIIRKVATDFKDITGNSVRIEVDMEESLPVDVAGGVELRSLDDKFRLVNTLDARLEVVSKEVVPNIRLVLFGANPNRKFDD